MVDLDKATNLFMFFPSLIKIYLTFFYLSSILKI
nr:MAG TPA: hypothetical protein [Caudoviricetes sp.]